MFMTVLKADFDSLKNREYPVDFDDREFMHKWITSQTGTSRAEEQILYRIDKTKDAVYMYIQSDHEFPDKNVVRAGMKKLKSFPINSISEQRIVFRIFCSTEHCVNDHRRFIEDSAKRKEWIEKRISVFMDEIQIHELKTDNIIIKGGKKIRGTEFIGEGFITDSEAFFTTVKKGIGREKNYGMGLFLFKEKV